MGRERANASIELRVFTALFAIQSCKQEYLRIVGAGVVELQGGGLRQIMQD